MTRTEHAAVLCKEHGRDAATWVEIDAGNADHVLNMINDGDPRWHDTVPPPFSGEFADSYSLLDLYEEIGVDVDEVVDYMTDVFAEAYEAAFNEAYEAEIVRVCRYHLSEQVAQ